MCGACPHLVTSTTATTATAISDIIPTGAYDPPNTIRSDYVAYLVNSSGDVSYFNGINVDFSYGVYPHKFKYHYREINSRLGHLWKERRE